ncbi:LamG-like jellyroll fold domain-containing protein [Rubritalea tangerina]|uniref:LamG-like jellyroll fold domain-containing protein n=1 Tax=Rubritalea tangerina TaxID=430798 RepID=A0ABW4ZAR3_9BACT
MDKLHPYLLTLLLGTCVSASASLSENLLAYFPLNNSYENQLDTPNLSSATAINTPSFAAGLIDQSLALTGAQNQHIQLATSYGANSMLGENFTLSAWYNLNSPITSTNTSNRYFVFEGKDNYDISYGIRDSALAQAGINDGQVYSQDSSQLIADAALPGWHHVLQRYSSADGLTTITTFIDGVLSSTLTLDTSKLAGDAINFGAARSSVNNRGFDGKIDEIALWNRSLTDEECATVFALGLNQQNLIHSGSPAPAPTIASFTATPSTLTLGESTTLNWNVTSADSVTLVNGPNQSPLTGTFSETLTAEKTYTLVAIKSGSYSTQQITVNIIGPTDPVGPYVGTIKPTEAYFLYSPGQQEETLRLSALDSQGQVAATDQSTSLAQNDFVAKFHLTGLSPNSNYSYKIEKVNADNSTTLYAGGDATHHFSTTNLARKGHVVTAAFISCANDTSNGVWSEMANHNLDLLCLSGDTPYVDTGDLTLIRQKHRHFLQVPTLASLGKNTSTVGTWDDHDFGINGGNGLNTAGRKVNTRRGFVEYRAHDQYGHDNLGIYHKTDLGAMEVFLLDPRWFSQTEASPVNASQSSCFGATQWQWLLNSIRNSKAPFKVILQGQIWQDKKNSETDDMFTYWAERDALFDTIRDEKIPGVVLFGGDIHVARYLMHPQRVGYDLHDFVMSPGHKSIISSLNVYHPSLEWSRETQNQFLTMQADTTKEVPELTVKYLDQEGNVNHQVTLAYDQLSPKGSDGLANQLRAYWSFDQDLSNASPLGQRLNASAHNGAQRIDDQGIRGGALQLGRSQSQYLSVPRSFLDDNAPAYTVSAWCKPSTLPAHGSTDRYFLLESMVNNHTGDLPSSTRTLGKASTTGYAISVGIQASSDPTKVNVQLHTETLLPRAVGSQQAPGTTSHGGFDFDVDRNLFDQWTQLAISFDSQSLHLYLNGALAKSHSLNLTAPIAETGGLIIGGHRAGTGRNFDGLIDEVAIWNRSLTAAEILSLYGAGAPPAIPTKISHLDSDDDALPDWWEELYGLDKTNPSDALADPDADQMTTLEEFGFGLNPLQGNTPPSINLSPQIQPDQSFLKVNYTRSTKAKEFIEFHYETSNSLQPNSWITETNVTETITPLNNDLERISAITPTQSPPKNKDFLRVRLRKKSL